MSRHKCPILCKLVKKFLLKSETHFFLQIPQTVLISVLSNSISVDTNISLHAVFQNTERPVFVMIYFDTV